VYLIGLTGGIASGKSVVSRRLAELGAVHVDADLIARQVVEPGTPGLAAIAEAFGPAVIAADGSLDRAALGAIVFSDEPSRLILNGITHPAVQRAVRDQIEAARAADPDAVVIYDVPLLAEGGLNGGMALDEIVVVHAEPQTRIARMIANRGMTREEALARMASQASDQDRLAIADTVIHNDGDLEATFAAVDELWSRVSSR
jgi:dephospho-CoA kinase